MGAAEDELQPKLQPAVSDDHPAWRHLEGVRRHEGPCLWIRPVGTDSAIVIWCCMRSRPPDRALPAQDGYAILRKAIAGEQPMRSRLEFIARVKPRRPAGHVSIRSGPPLLANGHTIAAAPPRDARHSSSRGLRRTTSASSKPSATPSALNPPPDLPHQSHRLRCPPPMLPHAH